MITPSPRHISSRADTLPAGSITRIQRMSIRRASLSPFDPSLSSTRRRPFASLSHTQLPPAAIPPRSSALLTPSRPATGIASQLPSTGSLVMMLSSTQVSRMTRLSSCSLSSALSSHTSDSHLCQRRRLQLLSRLEVH